MGDYLRSKRVPEYKCNNGVFGGAHYFSDLAMGVPFHAYSGTENEQTVKYVFAVPVPDKLANPGAPDSDKLANVPYAQTGSSGVWRAAIPTLGTVGMSWYGMFAPKDNGETVAENYVMFGTDVVPKIGAVLEFRQRGAGLPPLPFEEK